MAFYDDMRALAKRLLSEKGETSFLVRRTPGTPPISSKPWEPGAPGTAQTGVSAAYFERSILRRDTLVKNGESFVILAASDLSVVPDPSTDELVRASGARYAIVEVHPLDPGGQAVIFELKVQK